MQAKMLRDEEITHPRLKSAADIAAWRAKLDREEITPQEWRDGMFLKIKAGTVIDHPHAHRLVAMGMAEPHDKECSDRCKRLEIDAEVTAEGQDRTRAAQLTGDRAFDRDPVVTETDDDEERLNAEAERAIQEETPIVISSPVIEDPVPDEQQSEQQKAATK
jgi:predicted nucleic acid-binding Zn ribbon protein